MKIWISALLLVLSLCILAVVRNKPPVKADPYIGQRFYDTTKLSPDKEITPFFINGPKPDLYKAYPLAAKIKLIKPDFKGLLLEEAIKKRRSKRQGEQFSSAPLAIGEVSQLLFSAAGITGANKMFDLRASPSAGALYPIEIYLVINNVSGLEKGIYHYSVASHNLELIKSGDFSKITAYAAMGQPGVEEAAAVFVFTAIPARTTAKYDLRGWRYVYMEAGYISENLYLEAASLGLLTTAMGAFYDDEVNKLLDIDGRKEIALHIQIFGKDK